MPIIQLPNNKIICSFYDQDDKPWYCLTNFWYGPVIMRDAVAKKIIKWPTLEHYFQAQKIHECSIKNQFINDMKDRALEKPF